LGYWNYKCKDLRLNSLQRQWDVDAKKTPRIDLLLQERAMNQVGTSLNFGSGVKDLVLQGQC